MKLTKSLVKDLRDLPDSKTSPSPSLEYPIALQRPRPVRPSVPRIHCPYCGERIDQQLIKLYTVELIKLGKQLARKVKQMTKLVKESKST